MTDIRIVRAATVEAVTVDWLMTPAGVLDTSQELATAATVALATDGRAQASDILPDPDSTDRRGWWGDLDAEELWGGWPIGSRLWLLARAKITGAEARDGSTVAKAEGYVREALAPFVTRRVASRVAVSGERVGRERIDVAATIYRGPDAAIELLYQSLWNEIGAR